MKNFIGGGKKPEFTAPVGGVVSGGLYAIGSLVVAAQGTAAAGEKFVGVRGDIVQGTLKDGDAPTEGQKMYLLAGELTVDADDGGDPATEYPFVGWCMEAGSGKVLLQ